MSDKPKHDDCPDCKGEKVKRYTPHHAGCFSEECEHQEEVRPCPTCRGKGTLDPLGQAVYRARGGPAPAPIHGGFA